MNEPFGLSARLPWLGPLTMVAVRVSWSASVSLVSTLPETAVSSAVLTESPTATGDWLVGLMITVAVSVSVP